MPKSPSSSQILVAAALAVAALCAAAASPEEASPVLTRARLGSSFEGSDGRFYVRLKLLPRAKIPFTVQAFRVRDRALLAGIAEGATVKFTTRYIDGENTLTSIRTAAECRRFQPCD